jgi:type IV secretory pathway TrbL component
MTDEVKAPTIESERDEIDRLLEGGQITWDQYLKRAGDINVKYTGVRDSIMDPIFDWIGKIFMGIFIVIKWVFVIGIPILIGAAVVKWAWLTLTR